MINRILFSAFFSASMVSCLSRGYNQDSDLNGVFPIVASGGYYTDRIPFAGEDFVYTSQRIAPSMTQGQSSYVARGWLICATGISGQASCSVRLGKNDAILANSTEVFNAIRRRLPAPKKPTGESVFEWKISIPYEARMQVGDDSEAAYAVEFGSTNLSDGPADPKKEFQKKFSANALLGIRVEPSTLIPVMERLRIKAKIPKGVSFSEANIVCARDKTCFLSATEGGTANGAAVSERIDKVDGLIAGVEKEWSTLGTSAASATLFSGRARLFYENERPPVLTPEQKADAAKKKKDAPVLRRNTVALVSFYTIEFLDE